MEEIVTYDRGPLSPLGEDLFYTSGGRAQAEGMHRVFDGFPPPASLQSGQLNPNHLQYRKVGKLSF